MKKQDNRLAFSIIAALMSGIALIYILIRIPQILFAVIGVSVVFLITTFIAIQNIISFSMMKSKSFNIQVQNCTDQLATQIDEINEAQSNLAKATFLYTKQAANRVTTLENHYTESQEALFRNLTSISAAQTKSTKLMIRYNQNNTQKLVSALKEVRNSLNETMIQGFDQIQPDNGEVVSTLVDIVTFLKSQPNNLDQTMGLQLNNVAHELQNISNSIQRAQIPVATMPQMQMAPAPMTQAVNVAPAEEVKTEAKAEAMVNSEDVMTEEPVVDMHKDHLDSSDLDELFGDLAEPVEETMEEVAEDTNKETLEDVSVAVEEIAEDASTDTDPNKQLSPDEIAALFAAAEPTPKKEEPDTTTVSPDADTEETPTVSLSDDPNKQLSPDEIAALFAAAEPSPKKEEPVDTITEEESFTPTFTVVGKEDESVETAEEAPATIGDLTDDPNRQLSPDEIAALFAAAEPAPKKEEPKKEEPIAVTPISDDPNKQLSPDEIAALFASLG